MEGCSGYSAGAWLPHPRGDSQRRALWRATAKKAAVRHRLEGRGGKGDELENFYADNMADEELSASEYLSGELGIEHYYRHPRSYARRGAFSASEPSPTIRGVNRPVPPRYPGHRLGTVPASEVRSLTTRERGRIQTFPKSWVWDHRLPKTVTEQLVGNAVPVKLARFVAEGIRAALF